MEIINGYQVFEKEELNKENSIAVLSDMIQNLDRDIPSWNKGCGMRKIMECQRDALYKAITALEYN